jgi:hypothetical protein
LGLKENPNVGESMPVATIPCPECDDLIELDIENTYGVHLFSCECGNEMKLNLSRFIRKAKAAYKQREWLHKQYVEEGMSMADIATQCGVSPMTIHNWLITHDIQKRSRGRRSK